MSFSFKKALCALLLPAAMLTLASCAGKDTAYETNNEEGYTVSVRYDANGGSFGDSNTWAISDSYNIKGMKENADGMVELPIIPPDDENRTDLNLKVKNSGYYFVGWFAEKTEHTDDNGKTYYSYGGKWNFDAENIGTSAYKPDTLKIDPTKSYKAEEPVLTLYAVWAPKFEIKFYDLNAAEGAEPYFIKEFNPANGTEFTLPYWVDGEATANLGDIPEKKGFTFKAAYTDGEAGKEELKGKTFKHIGALNSETGEIEGEASMNVYVEWSELKEYRIYTAEQFVKNYSPSAHYTLYGDLDFTGINWPSSLVTGAFSGSINGNGHTISNIAVECNNTDKTSFGLFGRLENTAKISDVKFNNISFTISKGARKPGTYYGLFAGTVSNALIENVTIDNSTLALAHDIYFATDDYTIDLICGNNTLSIDHSDISCVVTEGGKPEYNIKVEGTAVELVYGDAEETSDEEVSTDEASNN
ncbi:MAG: hypothetical protein IJB65_06465 [Clostridia bacterium]|nr:hypothetical protein [Clostridia bacterium]